MVSPSHVVAQILAALVIAVEQGLRLPLVYNSGGYDSLEALKLLDGVVDIYMPDFSFGTALRPSAIARHRITRKSHVWRSVKCSVKSAR
jgi:putative pyruvate formate lyase activating enzyme